MKTRLIMILMLTATLLGACATTREMSIHDAWIRPSTMGNNSAAYFIIENGTGMDDTLLSVDSDIASATEVHLSMVMDGGVMSMQQQESVPVPTSEKVEFKPGGLHVMFVGLTQDLKVGDTITLTLNFENAGTRIVEVPIREP